MPVDRHEDTSDAEQRLDKHEAWIVRVQDPARLARQSSTARARREEAPTLDRWGQRGGSCCGCYVWAVSFAKSRAARAGPSGWFS